jgi:hypothetical protein
MKATDLRIGNLVNYYTSEGDVLTNVIDWQDLKWLSEDEQGFNLFHKPIPLTEEWLLKLGFEVYEFHHKENQYGFKDKLIVIRDGLFCDYGTSVIIKHVHQLQNFFFALTGSELIVKDLK